LFLTLTLVFVASMGAVSAASGDNIYVNASSGDDNYDGLSAIYNSSTGSGPKLTIKNATGTVNSNGVVYIADGQYNGAGNTNILLDWNMTLIGQSQTGTVINGSGMNWLFDINQQVTVNFINLTFANTSSNYGSAIYNLGGNVTVNGCTFTDNVALEMESGGVGGAIASEPYSGEFIFHDATLSLENCIFNNNYANHKGGAVYNFGTLSVINCSFLNNSASMGGAIYNYQSLATIINACNFTNNTAFSVYEEYYYDYGGAAISNYESAMNIVDSNFTGNDATASDGAAIHNFEGYLNVTGSTFAFNEGGAIINDHQNFNEGPGLFFTEGDGFFNYGVLDVINCTFINNTCEYNGAAIWNDGPCTVTGSVFVNNTAGYLGGAIYNQYYGLTVNFNRFAGNSADYYGDESGDGDAIYTDIYYGPQPAFTTFVSDDESPQNIENNWWGSNDPDFDTLLYGVEDPYQWLYMTINATPGVINNGNTSLITVSFNNLFNGTDIVAFNPATGHIPDGTPVTFNTDLGSIGSKTIQKETINGVATATLTADELAGVAHINATTDNQTVYVNVTINPKSSLYLIITPAKTNLVVGETVLYTLKVGNNGPDTAKDVVMTYVIPTGLEFAGATKDVGNWTYDNLTRTITWIIGDVPLGDPVMNISLFVVQAGIYPINPALWTSTYDPTLGSSVQSLTVIAAEQTSNGINGTIPMQDTGVPLNYLLMAVLMILGGFLVPRRK
jgi:uncharacterized repeat protein (TIGR01451 family)